MQRSEIPKADEAWRALLFKWRDGSWFELLLQPNGKFQWMLAVGALDQYAEGTWWKNGDCIGLKPDSKFKRI